MAKSTITTRLMKIFWPWFQRQVWPILEKKLLEALAKLIEDLMNTYVGGRARRDTEKQQEAERKAAAAAERAKNAVSKDEAAAARREAEMWKGVAVYFKQEASLSKKEMERLRKQLRGDLGKTLKDMKPTLSDDGGGQVTIADESTPLQLPDVRDEEPPADSTDPKERP